VLDFELLEVTTHIGCPVHCEQYCPQEVITQRYAGNRTLSLDDWRLALRHIPPKLPIVFSGFCEPFANRHVIDLIHAAYVTGHPLAIFTTLYQATQADIKKLIKYPFLEFVLHLPDGHAMLIPLSEEYKDNVFAVLQNVKNVKFMIMNDDFQDDYRQCATRGQPTKRKRLRFCKKLNAPQFVLLPNGDVTLCSHDFGLWHILGNLFTEHYGDIRRRFVPQKRAFKLCSMCSQNSLTKTVIDFAGRLRTYLE
jgi:hypothetical protein